MVCNFYVIIYLLSFDITKVRRLQILEHGEFTPCDGQFSLSLFWGKILEFFLELIQLSASSPHSKPLFF